MAGPTLSSQAPDIHSGERCCFFAVTNKQQPPAGNGRFSHIFSRINFIFCRCHVGNHGREFSVEIHSYCSQPWPPFGGGGAMLCVVLVRSYSTFFILFFLLQLSFSRGKDRRERKERVREISVSSFSAEERGEGQSMWGREAWKVLGRDARDLTLVLGVLNPCLYYSWILIRIHLPSEYYLVVL